MRWAAGGGRVGGVYIGRGFGLLVVELSPSFL